MTQIDFLDAAADIAYLKGYALARYEEGYDTFIECYSATEWADLASMGRAEAVSYMTKMASIWLDRQGSFTEFEKYGTERSPEGLA